MINKEDLHCYYSGLPSPLSYVNDVDEVKEQEEEEQEEENKTTIEHHNADYDGMGNFSRFPISRETKRNKKNFKMKRIIQKIILWWSFKKPKSKRNSIWNI